MCKVGTVGKISDCQPEGPGVPGISLPRDITPPPPQGQIPRDLALPAHPPLGISPHPNDTFQRIFLYLDLATKKASEIWFGNLFDNGFARESDSEPMLSDIFKS